MAGGGMTSSHANNGATALAARERPPRAAGGDGRSRGAGVGAIAGGRALRSAEKGARITIELSPAQVDRIVRDAVDGGTMSVLLAGLEDVRAVLADEPQQLEDNRLSRSLLAGLLMLASFPADGTFVSNAEIARRLSMSPSTTYRYVSTLLAVGLLERDPETRRYRLM
jgi:DNA-binding MarR family transcriptional regulator